MRRYLGTLALALLPLGIGACGGGPMTISGTAQRLPALADVSEAQWSALANRQIFFGHQSVGGNILKGITALMRDHPRIRLNIVESKSLDSARPAFRHAPVGRNDYPIEKIDEMVRIAGQFGGDSGVAMVKLCYTDAHTYTDPRELFNDYQRRIAALRQQHPNLTIVHFTIPLTGIENWKGRLRATLTGKSTERDRNRIRHQYNELIRQAYEGREPLLDVARLESTRADGSRMVYRHGRDTVPMMVPEYTSDGGHLNASAQRMVAEQFLVLLARLGPQAAASRPS